MNHQIKFISNLPNFIFQFIFQLSWQDRSGNEITDGVENSQELMSDGKRYTVKSTLKIQAESEHHNSVFTCLAKSAAEKIVKNVEMKIEVSGLYRFSS